MRRRYIFFDIDGTLAVGTPGRQYVPDSARRAVRMLEDAGHFVAIATGRAHAMAVDTMRELGFRNMVSDGGYGITIDGKFLGAEPLPREEVIALIDECQEKGFIWGIQADDSDTRLVPDERFMAATTPTWWSLATRRTTTPCSCPSGRALPWETPFRG